MTKPLRTCPPGLPGTALPGAGQKDQDEVDIAVSVVREEAEERCYWKRSTTCVAEEGLRSDVMMVFPALSRQGRNDTRALSNTSARPLNGRTEIRQSRRFRDERQRGSGLQLRSAQPPPSSQPKSRVTYAFCSGTNAAAPSSTESMRFAANYRTPVTECIRKRELGRKMMCP